MRTIIVDLHRKMPRLAPPPLGLGQRRREIGIRMAVGVRPAAVTWMVVRQSLHLSLIGIALGAAVAGAVATLMRGILFGLPPLDPIT